MPHAIATDTVEVLIVDDEPETRELLADFCRSLGFEVATAQDGRAALSAFSRAPQQYGVVLTDLHMPGADGLEVLRAVKAANPSCYVVMITGYATLDSAVQAVKAGAYDYLAKPFALGQLEIVLSRIRDRMSLERENKHLSHQMLRNQTVAQGRPDTAWRLESIEHRLTEIESLLRALLQAR